MVNKQSPRDLAIAKLAAAKTQSTRRAAFVGLCRLELAEEWSSQFKRADAAYQICSAIQYDDLCEDPITGRIIELACDLELPAEHQSSDPDVGWHELKDLVQRASRD